MQVDILSGVETIRAWHEICKHLTEQDIEELESLDDKEVARCLMGLLVEANLTTDDAEDLLVRVGLLEGELA